MEIDQHIKFWIDGADHDLEAAESSRLLASLIGACFLAILSWRKH